MNIKLLSISLPYRNEQQNQSKMFRVVLVVLCTLALFLPATAFLESAAPLSIQATAGMAAKVGAGATVSTSFLPMSASVNPASMVVGVAVGVGVGVSFSAGASSSSGQSYLYNDTNSTFRSKLQSASRITHIEKYSSPVSQLNVEHHEIVIEIGGLIWGVLSFGIDGLEAIIEMEKDKLISRRPNNTLIESKKVNIPTKKLRDFLKKYEGKSYRLLFWNCRHFSQALWDAIDESQSYIVTDADFLDRIKNASRITHIERYNRPMGYITFQHHEIIFQIDDLFWGLISFRKDGLEARIAISKDGLIVRKPDNRFIEGKKVDTQAVKLLEFLQKQEDQAESNLFLTENKDCSQALFIWNSQKISQALWEVIVQQ